MAKKRAAKKNGKVEFIDPYIRVKNVGRAADWYKRMLGFKVRMAIPDGKKPAFVRMGADGSDGAAIMISDGSDPLAGKKVAKTTMEAVAARKAQKVVTFYYRVDGGIDGLFRSVKRKKAKVVAPIQDMDYGMREFTIRDPDGYDVSVGQDL